MIDVRKLSKSYGRATVLDEADLSAEPGEITLLAGDNGAGKSTTLKILAGLIRPTSAERLRVDGIDVRQRRQAQTRMAYLPQGASFHPAMTLAQILGFYGRLRDVSAERIENLLNTFQLGAFAGQPVRELSGGMVQRIALAVLFLPDASVLLADEPVASLDPDWRDRLQVLLRREAANGKTILVATHFLEEWGDDRDKVLFCRQGRFLPDERQTGKSVHANPGRIS